MGIAYAKVKSTGKTLMSRGKDLDNVVLSTMKTISDIVGSTLGPGGQSVLLERQEDGLPNFVTKDGVTVFKSLGFTDPVRHAIMESARDASVRTANEAGDGTTTATILSYSIVKNIADYTRANPKISPQKVIRDLQHYFKTTVEPTIRSCAIPCDSSTAEGKSLLWNVAKISANGESQIADAVMECYSLVGDAGNVTITEVSGPTGYEVEKIEGFPISVGYEDSCTRYYQKFMNDKGGQRVFLEDPVFVLFFGRITDIQQVTWVMEKIGYEWQANKYNHNVVLVATGFGEGVIAQLAMNFAEMTTINVVPLIAPMNAIANSQYDFMLDLAAVTGAKIFDVLNSPLPRSHDEVDLKDFGYGVKAFEMTRFRSTVIGHSDEVLIEDRVATLEKQLNQSAGSILETTYLTERIGKITGGIAKLKVIGASNGELRERRDRAEDAILAVRKAVEFGATPGGGWMLARLYVDAREGGDSVVGVLAPALLEPIKVLFSNLGYNEEEIADKIERLIRNAEEQENIQDAIVFDAQEGIWTRAVEGGVLDSVPAVLEAIRNSLSIASLLGTLGGVVVFPRDLALERQEARDIKQYMRDADINPADERA